MWEITEVLVTYMRQVREVLYGYSFHPIAGLLSRLLLTHYQPIEEKPLPRDLTPDEIAGNIGTNRQLVSKILHHFANDGMIEISHMQFIFNNRDQLEKLAKRD
mgnify:FL=1